MWWIEEGESFFEYQQKAGRVGHPGLETLEWASCYTQRSMLSRQLHKDRKSYSYRRRWSLLHLMHLCKWEGNVLVLIGWKVLILIWHWEKGKKQFVELLPGKQKCHRGVTWLLGYSLLEVILCHPARPSDAARITTAMPTHRLQRWIHNQRTLNEEQMCGEDPHKLAGANWHDRCTVVCGPCMSVCVCASVCFYSMCQSHVPVV